MLSIAELREQLGVVEVGRILGLELREGTQTCPFCQGEKKFKVSHNQRFRCYRPACGKSGNIMDLPILLGKAKTNRDSWEFLNGCVGNRDYRAYYQRCDILQKAFEWYQATELPDEVLELLTSRGYSRVLDQVEFGYAPGVRYLQGCGMQLADLVKVGLAYSNGAEFFSDRLIFPIHDAAGRVVHVQGRACADQELRWLSTPSADYAVNPITHYLYGAKDIGTVETLFLTEGISDCLSLKELGLPAVASFGIASSFVKHSELFGKLKHLVAVYDNDRYPLGVQNAGQYKSWPLVLRSLTELKEALPDLTIWCITPPDRPGLKDLNDWLQQGLTQNKFLRYVDKRAQRLEEFAIQALGDSWEYQELLLRLVAVNKRPEAMALLKEAQQALEPDELLFMMRLIGSP